MTKLNLFYRAYTNSFYISKFLLIRTEQLFRIVFIKYKTDINKISLVSMFWVFFILFGQLPKLYMYNRQKVEKISHGFLLITKRASTIPTIIKKITNFFLLSSSPELTVIKKKTKTKIDNIVLKDNDYFNELVNIPRLYIEPYDIVFSVMFRNLEMSAFEKAQVLRILQIPIVTGWTVKKKYQKHNSSSKKVVF